MRIALLLVVLAACSTDATEATDAGDTGDTPDAASADEACHFPSGRPCPIGKVCLGPAGTECNYVSCSLHGDERSLTGTAVRCGEAPIAEVPGGPFDCDPGGFANLGETGSFTPPQRPCPLGGLWTIENGFWGRCVPTSQCLPLACDPTFGDDGCPSFHRCEAGTCRVVASEAGSRP